MEFLRDNARDFLDNARLSLRSGEYNLAMFSLEQALRLGLKYCIAKPTGSFPKTHDVVELLRRAVELTGDKRLEEILKAEISTLDLLKRAYIASRCLPTSYDREAVEEALSVVEAILSELGVP